MWPDLIPRGAAGWVVEAVEPGLSVDGTTADSCAWDCRGRDRMARLPWQSSGRVKLPAELVQSLWAWILERTNRPLETARGVRGPLKGGLGIRYH